MVQNMGFERFEASSIIVPNQSRFELGSDVFSSKVNECVLEVSQSPKTEFWPEEIRKLLVVKKTTQGFSILIDKNTTHEQLGQIQSYVVNSVSKKDAERVKSQLDDHRIFLREAYSPAEMGEAFRLIPQLCMMFDGELELVDKEMLSFAADFNLLDEKVGLTGFDVNKNNPLTTNFSSSVNSIDLTGNPCLRNGKILLIENLDIQDQDFNSAFTIKTYSSEKEVYDENWRHTSIVLRPNSYDDSYKEIIINNENGAQMKVIGEFVKILK
jgi:hypothetical protein